MSEKASQSIELDTLIPLRFGCHRIIQVGDPEQLPATVLSTLAQQKGFAQSLFERTYRRFGLGETSPIKMLQEQFRMHPEICSFPSKNFYNNKLVTSK